jgi:hypothetical protein
MLTIRYARPEMRHPTRAWLRNNARTLLGVGISTIVMAVAARFAADCEPMPTGWLDCPVAAEGAMVMNLASAPTPTEPPPPVRVAQP